MSSDEQRFEDGADDSAGAAVLAAALEALDGRDPIPFDQLVTELRAGGHLDHLGDGVLQDPISTATAVQEILDRQQETTGGGDGDGDSEVATPAERRREQIRAERERRFGFDQCCEAPYRLVEDALHELIRDGGTALEDSQLTEVAGALTHSSVPLALFAHATEMHSDGVEHLRALAERLTALEGDGVAPALLLSSLAAEEDGDLIEAERLLEQAVVTDASYEAAKFVLSRYSAERGDPRRTLDLLVESNQGFGPYLDLLRYLLAPPGDVGRNDPCPCGSGRKYKHCCLREPRVPDHKRAVWLQRRIHQYVSTRQAPTLAALVAEAEAAIPHDGDEDGDQPGPAESLSGDPFLISVAMHHLGLAEQYLEDRTALLDDIDRNLLESWRSSRFRAYDVKAVAPGESILLADLAGGDQIRVTSPPGSPEPDPDSCLLAVVGPVGDSLRFIGPAIALPCDSRDDLAELVGGGEPTAEALARWYGSAH